MLKIVVQRRKRYAIFCPRPRFVLLQFNLVLSLQKVMLRAFVPRAEALLGIDIDGDGSVGSQVEWINDCVETLMKLA